MGSSAVTELNQGSVFCQSWMVRLRNRHLCSAALMKVLELLGNVESNGLIQFRCLFIML